MAGAQLVYQHLDSARLDRPVQAFLQQMTEQLIPDRMPSAAGIQICGWHIAPVGLIVLRHSDICQISWMQFAVTRQLNTFLGP